MKLLNKINIFAVVCILLISGCSSTPKAINDCFYYAKVGVGYKFQEMKMMNSKTGKFIDDPISGRVELGNQCNNISYGISHHSQPFSGFPLNDKLEYHKTEIFVDYMYKF